MTATVSTSASQPVVVKRSELGTYLAVECEGTLLLIGVPNDEPIRWLRDSAYACLRAADEMATAADRLAEAVGDES